MYKIFFTLKAQKALLQLSKNTAKLIRQKLDQLASDPYAPGLDPKKLHNRPGYRLRIGDFRVIYEINKDELLIMILKIAQRGEVYR